MKKILHALIVIPVFLLVLSACQKDEDEKGNNILAAKEGALAVNLFDDVFKQADAAGTVVDNEFIKARKSGTLLMPGCPSINIEPYDAVTFPKIIIINFGEEDCVGADLRRRRGILVVNMSDWYRKAGSTLTVTTQDYYVDDYKVEGTKTIVNQGRNNDENLVYTVSVANGVITHPDGKITEWNTTRTNEWVEGEDTPLVLQDDVYHITGSGSGVTSDGKSYDINILTALDVQYGCRWIRGGILEVVPQNTQGIQVDFGDGTCDANAEAILLGIRIPFVMN